MTEEEAEELRRSGWQVEDPRTPRDRGQRAALKGRKARLLDRAERVALREYGSRESLRLAERARNEHLWRARLFFKVPHNLSPRVWREVEADYLERWCKSNGIPCRRDGANCTWEQPQGGEGPQGAAPEMDYLRSIVFGWADGAGQGGLEEAVRFCRERGRPAIDALQPILTSRFPGPALQEYIEGFDRHLPALNRILDEWPDSPLALARFEETVRSEFGCRPEGELIRSADPTLFVDSEHRSVLEEVVRRQRYLADLLNEAETRLGEMGWARDSDGRLYEARPGRRGQKPSYLTRTIGGLHAYLRPIYRRTFDGHELNPEPLRSQISRLLSPFFKPAELSTARKGPIWRAVNNLVHLA